MELAAALAAPLAVDAFGRPRRHVVRVVDGARLSARLFRDAPERLPVRRLARVAVEDERRLAAGGEGRGARVSSTCSKGVAGTDKNSLDARSERLDLLGRGADADEEAHVEVDREAELRLDVAAVAGGRRREGVQDETKGLRARRGGT